MNLVIRKMTLDDLPQVVAIDQKSFSLPWPERSFRFECENPVSRCWVAELDSQIAAMLVAWMIVDELHIATIATHPQFRRMGIGTQLLSHVLLTAKEEGALTSLLEVRENNDAAQEMYRNFGYEEAGRREHYYSDNGEDALLMNLPHLDQWMAPAERLRGE